ncbi:recombinase family protein [Rhodococcus erythropolis]|uniref:recombinase family protein n=1 Tax=Rhodococcus erythropolis TaxID=1833 RepID=UPI003A4DF7C1
MSDLDVSGTRSPFERENLGRALADPSGYDLLIFYRIDRLPRSMLDLAKIMAGPS